MVELLLTIEDFDIETLSEKIHQLPSELADLYFGIISR
jgi:hypothetical protein